MGGQRDITSIVPNAVPFCARYKIGTFVGCVVQYPTEDFWSK